MTLPPGETAYLDEGLAASTTYIYRARAFNANGDSANSNEATATTDGDGTGTAPAAPTSLVATAQSPTRINLGWTGASGDETGFKVERKTGANGAWSQVATLRAGAAMDAGTGESRVRSLGSDDRV